MHPKLPLLLPVYALHAPLGSYELRVFSRGERSGVWVEQVGRRAACIATLAIQVEG